MRSPRDDSPHIHPLPPSPAKAYHAPLALDHPDPLLPLPRAVNLAVLPELDVVRRGGEEGYAALQRGEGRHELGLELGQGAAMSAGTWRQRRGPYVDSGTLTNTADLCRCAVMWCTSERFGWGSLVHCDLEGAYHFGMVVWTM